MSVTDAYLATLPDEEGREPVSPEAAERLRYDANGILHDPMAEREYAEAFVRRNIRWLEQNWYDLPKGERTAAKHYLKNYCHNHKDVTHYRHFARTYLVD